MTHFQESLPVDADGTGTEQVEQGRNRDSGFQSASLPETRTTTAIQATGTPRDALSGNLKYLNSQGRPGTHNHESRAEHPPYRDFPGNRVQGRPCVPEHPFEQWLTSLRTREINITVRDDAIELNGPATHNDTEHANRHTHALQTAAAGTHGRWWEAVTGKIDQGEVHVDDIPTTACPWSQDGLAFACTCCGQPADTLDSQLLAWCPACQQ